MIKQTITVNRKKYATGLFWQPVGVGNASYNYVKNLVKNLKQKYNLFIDYKSMVGLGNSKTGIRFGMPSAAVEVLNSLSEFSSFLGVFKTDDHYYLIAVRNGIIIRDILLETESQARNLYVELSNIPDWGALFAPVQWGMPKSQEKFLSDIISSNVSGRLRNISIIKSLLPSVFFVIVFALFGFYMFHSPINEMISKKEHKLDPELAKEYKRQIELKNKELDKQYNIVKKEIKPIVHPYDNLPNTIERANLCYKAIGFVMQPISGWNQTYAKCDGDYVTATFTRDFGTLNDFYEIGGQLMPGALVQQTSDKEILVRAKMPSLPTNASLEERDQETVMREISTLFQKMNVVPEMQGVTDTLTNGVDTEEINVIELSVSSKLIPYEFMQIFNGFEGVYMTAANWRANTRTWNYEIIIYTK
ncbi:MAG: type 4b pilus protein PilO2 [Alphaproteobacteria bacterium]|nr:type 4b pilus protein PilO2 [Alphaproteobacteria bacterium]